MRSFGDVQQLRMLSLHGSEDGAHLRVNDRRNRAETTKGADRSPRPSARSGSSHSHSMVPGGFDVTSSTTRLTSRTSLVMRVEMVASTS